MLCFTPSGKQHPGSLPHPFPSIHRCLHQMVARETGTTSLSAQGPLVFESKPPAHLKTISPEMASTNSGLPSPLSFTVLQNRVHQTRSGVGPTLQPRTGHLSMVHRHYCHLLLPTLVQIQKSCSQPFRPPLGPSGFTPS